MPNHIHRIIFIADGVGATRHMDVGATRHMPETILDSEESQPDEIPDSKAGSPLRTMECGGGSPQRAPERSHPDGPPSGSLGAIIGQFKSRVTKRVWSMPGTSHFEIWQRNYYEHIIRNDPELAAIRQYILENPLKWENDQENPDRDKC